MQFGNSLVTSSWISVLDRTCTMGKLQAVLLRQGLLNGLESESLHSESCCENKFQETHDKARRRSGHP